MIIFIIINKINYIYNNKFCFLLFVKQPNDIDRKYIMCIHFCYFSINIFLYNKIS